ncbi:MAG: LysR family transcriptional regulator [Oscillospiraceae bacterium]
MDIRQLKYYITIADEAGVSAAARKLNMTQPPLSNCLKALEDELGVLLFKRESRKLVMTREGELLYRYAKKILYDFDETKKLFQDLKSGTAGTLNLAIVGSLSSLLIPLFISTYVQENPHIKLHVKGGNTTEILRMIDDNKVELGITAEPHNLSKYRAIRFDKLLSPEPDYLAVIALPHWFDDDKPTISVSSLRGKPLIMHHYLESFITDVCSQHYFEPNMLCLSDDVSTVVPWCINDLGMAIISNNSIRAFFSHFDNHDLVKKRLEAVSWQSHISLIWSKSHTLSYPAQSLIDIINRCLEDATVPND